MNSLDKMEDYDRLAEELAATKQKLEALEAERKEMEKQEPVRESAYHYIDRFLRNNLDDDAYAEYSQWLDAVYARPLPAPDLQKRVDELEAEVTRLSGASGFCIECERLSKENAELTKKLADSTKLIQDMAGVLFEHIKPEQTTLGLLHLLESVLSAARAEGIEEGKKMSGNYSVIGWLRGHEFIPLPELAIKSDEPVYAKRLVAPTHKEE